MDQHKKIKFNVKSEDGLQMELALDIETPYKVFIHFLNDQINHKTEAKVSHDSSLIKVYLEDKVIQEDEERTLKQIGFTDNCQVSINRQQLTVNFEINIKNRDTIKFQQKLPNRTSISEICSIVNSKVYSKTLAPTKRQQINQIQLEEIFELSKQKNESIESVLYDNCKLIFDVTIIGLVGQIPSGKFRLTVLMSREQKKYEFLTNPQTCTIRHLCEFFERYYASRLFFRFQQDALNDCQTLEQCGIYDGAQIELNVESIGG